MRSVSDHQQVIAGLITARPAATVSMAGGGETAQGLVLAADVVAPLALPGFDNSAMDGYAVVASDIAAASPDNPVKLPVAQDIPAGRTDSLTLVPGTAHRIMTGAPLPTGATAVVPVEQTDGGIDTVVITASVPDGKHIRRAGDDVAAGTTVLHAGQVLTPAALGLVAALGITEVTVRPRLRVLVASTGAELVAAGTPLRPGQIYESNAMMLAAAVREAGAEVIASITTDDDVAEFRQALANHLADADLVITTGGVSAGAYEVVKDALADSPDSTVEFTKVAMQPGMPQGCGMVTIDTHTVPIITFPGNPVSAMVSFEVFLRPVLRAAMDLPQPQRSIRTATLTQDCRSPLGKRQFQRGVLSDDGSTVTSYGPPASHHLRWLATANALVDVPEDITELAAGTSVQVWDLR